MQKKPWILGLGAFVLVLGSFLGVACDDDEDTGTDATPTEDSGSDSTPADSGDDTTPAE